MFFLLLDDKFVLSLQVNYNKDKVIVCLKEETPQKMRGRVV